jgi:hypothetical protein
MAKTSDVDLSVDLPGVTPVGLSLNFSVGAIPTCTVDLAPQGPGIIKIVNAGSGVLANPDSKKRTEVKVSVKVRSRDGAGGTTNHGLSWTGLLDGLSIGNTVGNNTYQAVLKGKAQTLLELTTLTPGLHATSIDIYKNPLYSVTGSTQEDNRAEEFFSSTEWSAALDPSLNPIEWYTKFLTHCLELQSGGYEKFLGKLETVDAEVVLQEVFSDERYKQAIQDGLRLFQSIDTSYVDSGKMSSLKVGNANGMGILKTMFSTGPNVVLENYLNFLRFVGCSIVCGNEKIFVVPEKSFIKGEHSAPGKKSSSSTPNKANPADYNSYIYNDNGYRDICAVILANPMPVGGDQLHDEKFEHCLVAHYIDKQQTTKASGVLVIREHPFTMYSDSNENAPKDAKEMKERADNGGESYYPAPYNYGGQPAKEDQRERAQEKYDNYQETLTEVMNNYAETKFYQARYADRQGSITLEFNPNWAPGATGVLFVRETKFFLDFFVESVTHRIDMSPPAGGTAITVVNFSCGRLGTSPIGVDKDQFLGVSKGTEKAFIGSFLGDIGAS